MIPDFRDFQGEGLRQLAHSAKGTTWTKKNAKYTDKVKTASGKTRYIYGSKKGGGTGSTVPFTVGYVGTLAMEADKSRKENAAREIRDILNKTNNSGGSFREALSTEQKNRILNESTYNNSEEKKTLVKNISDAIDSKEIGRAILLFDQKTGTSTIKVDGCEFKIPMDQMSVHKLNPKPGKYTDIHIGIPGTSGQVVRLADNSYGFKQLEAYQAVKDTGVTSSKARGNTKKTLGNLFRK